MKDAPGEAGTQPQATSPTSYLDLYGLSKSPFGGPGDSNGYILFNAHRRVFERLVDCMVNGSGLVVVYGDEGAGKSQMLAAAENLATASGLRVIKPDPPNLGRLDAPQLLAAILGSANVAHQANADVAAAIQCFLAPPRAVLLIDDLDRLTSNCVAVLVRILAQATAGSVVVLTASTDLQANPTYSDLARLESTKLQIPPLGPAETRQYIERSLWQAGGTIRRLVAADALRLIVARSNGLPGAINRVMEAVLTAGFARGDSLITTQTVAAALGASTTRSRDGRRGWTGVTMPAMAVGLLLIGVTAFLYRGLHGGFTPAPHLALSPSVPSAAIEQKVPQPSRPLEIANVAAATALMKRGEQSLALGDVAAARLSFQRAAEAGNPQAATATGKTYDPAFLSVGSDLAQASKWYRRAISLGDPEAADLLKRLQAAAAPPKR